MSSSRKRIPSLPSELEHGIDRLRQAHPSAGFDERLSARLTAADMEQARAAQIEPAARQRSWIFWFFIIPSVAAVSALMLTGYVLLQSNESAQPLGVVEHHVELQGDEHAWVNLDLSRVTTMDGDMVHWVDAPSDVSLHMGPEGQGIAPAGCALDRCRHRIEPAMLSITPVSARIPRAGRFEIRVGRADMPAPVHHLVVNARQ